MSTITFQQGKLHLLMNTMTYDLKAPEELLNRPCVEIVFSTGLISVISKLFMVSINL